MFQVSATNWSFGCPIGWTPSLMSSTGKSHVNSKTLGNVNFSINQWLCIASSFELGYKIQAPLSTKDPVTLFCCGVSNYNME